MLGNRQKSNGSSTSTKKSLGAIICSFFFGSRASSPDPSRIACSEENLNHINSVENRLEIVLNDLPCHRLDSILLVAEDTLSQIKLIKNHIKDQIETPHSLSFSPTHTTEIWRLKGISWDLFGTHAILYAGNGQIAYDILSFMFDQKISLFDKRIPVTVVTDQEMPGMTGTELIDKIMESSRILPSAIAIHSSLQKGENHPVIANCLTQWAPKLKQDGDKQQDVLIRFFEKNKWDALDPFIKEYCFKSFSLNQDHEKKTNSSQIL